MAQSSSERQPTFRSALTNRGSHLPRQGGQGLRPPQKERQHSGQRSQMPRHIRQQSRALYQGVAIIEIRLLTCTYSWPSLTGNVAKIAQL